jgi:hypothetical protein
MPAFHREISRAAAAFAGDCGLVFANCVPQRLGPPLRRLSPPSVPGFAFALNKEAAPESGLKGLGMLLCVWEASFKHDTYSGSLVGETIETLELEPGDVSTRLNHGPPIASMRVLQQNPPDSGREIDISASPQCAKS